MATSDKYRSAFPAKLDTIPEDILNDFIDDLCRNLRNEVKDDQKPGSQYCRHALYKNETFQVKSLSDLWARAVTPRYQHLLDDARTIEPTAQQHALMKCITFLDQTLLELLHGEQIPEEKPDLSKLLSCLLQRKQIKQKSTYAFYSVPNIALTIKDESPTTLSDAFSTLNYAHKSNSALLEQARLNYLAALDSQSKSSDFEENYISIDEYLQFQNDPQKEALIDHLVRDRCKQYCIAIFNQCRFSPDCFLPRIPEQYTSLKYVAQLTDYLVNAALSPDFSYYQPTIGLLTYLNMAQYVQANKYLHAKAALTEIGRDFDPIERASPTVNAQDNRTYQETLQFSDVFSDAWRRLYGTDVFNSSTHRFISLDDTAQRIYQDGHRAANYFDCEDSIFPFSLEEIKTMLCSYEKIISNPSRFYAYGQYLIFAPHLLTFILLSVFSCIAEAKIPLITKDLLCLFPSQSS